MRAVRKYGGDTMTAGLPFDTDRYDDMPVQVFIYDPIFDEGGELTDCRIVYANSAYKAGWALRFPRVRCIGSPLFDMGAIDRETLDEIDACRRGNPHTFSSDIEGSGLSVHLQPIAEIPEPYGGFYLTCVHISSDASSRRHFLNSMRQIGSAAMLLRETGVGTYEAVFASDEFARMMGYSAETLLEIVNRESFVGTTHPDDRLTVRRMLRRRSSDNGTHDLVIRKFTSSGDIIWLHTYYAFIDDFGEHYVYCTYFDLSHVGKTA